MSEARRASRKIEGDDTAGISSSAAVTPSFSPPGPSAVIARCEKAVQLGGGGVDLEMGSVIVDESVDPPPPPLPPNCVRNMPAEMHRAFRIKSLTLLVLQLSVSITIGSALIFSGNFYWTYIDGIQVMPLVALFVLGISFVILVKYQDTYPRNYYALALLSLCGGLFLAGFHRQANSFSDLQIMIYTTLSLFLTILFGGSIVDVPDFELEDAGGRERQPIDLKKAGLYGYSTVFVFFLAARIFSPTFSAIGEDGHFIMSLLMSACLFSWFVYDAHRMTAVLTCDDYMSSIITFYVDMTGCICACCTIGCCAATGCGANIN
jgi:hypothetical protein